MKRPLHDRIAAARQRKIELAVRLAALESKQKAADRKRDTRRKIVVGAAVLVEMEKTPRFADYVRGILDKAVTRPQDREAIAELLQAKGEAVAAAVNNNDASPAAATDSVASRPGPAAGLTVATRETLAGGPAQA